MSNSLKLDDIITIEIFRESWSQLRKDFSKDMIKDPINHVDYEMNLESNLSHLISEIKKGIYSPKPPLIILGAKGKGMNRPLAFLHIEDLMVFHSIIIKIAPLFQNELTPGVFALRPTDIIKRPFKSWYEEWPKYQRKILETMKTEGYSYLVTSDITTYFEDVDHRVLKESILAKGIQKEIVDLLFFLLENWTHRPGYSANPHRGLPQIQYNPSSFLSTIYLCPHDHRIEQIGDSIEYFRWIDDMNIFVKSEIEGKKVLSKLSQSLRDLYLSPNSGKTEILNREQVFKWFYFEENSFFEEFEQKSKGNSCKKGEVENILIEAYEEFLKKEKVGNWYKVLRRFYTYFKRIQSEYLLSSVTDHLIRHPGIVDKVCDYLFVLDGGKAYHIIKSYLQSDENLYESIEIDLVEFIVNLRLPKSLWKDAVNFAFDIFYPKQDRYSPLSWYTQALSSLIIAKYGENQDITKVAKHFCSNAPVEEEIRREYMIATSSLLGFSDSDFQKVLTKARREYVSSIQTLIRFIDTCREGEGIIPDLINKRLVIRRKYNPEISYVDIRTFILLKIISFNKNYYGVLMPIIGKLRKENTDPAIGEKLDILEKSI